MNYIQTKFQENSTCFIHASSVKENFHFMYFEMLILSTLNP